MAIRLPEERKKVQRMPAVVREEALSPQDVIDYRLTVEVDMGGGRKAWVKYGTESAVREGETTQDANDRVTQYVNREIDRRIEDLS